MPLHHALGVFLVSLFAFQAQRPAAQQGLIKHQFVARADRRLVTLEWHCQLSPALYLFGVPRGALAQDCKARTRIFATLVIVCCGGQQVVWKLLQTLQADLMEVLHRRTEVLRMETHIIARQ